MTDAADPRATLTDDEVARYHRQGFLVRRQFCTQDELEVLRAAYDELVDDEGRAAGDRMLGGLTRQIMIPSAAHAAFDRNPVVARAIAITRRLLGTDDVFRSFDMLIFKPAGHPHDTPWHQDMSYSRHPFAAPGTPIPLQTIQFWVALDDVDVTTGCMHFAPGHHVQPLLPHRIASGSPDDDGRLLAIVDPEEHLDLTAVTCAELPAGGATLHSYGTPHYTPANTSATRDRRAYIFNIATHQGARGLAGADA